MNIDINDIVTQLSQRIAQLEVDKALLSAQLNQLLAENAKLKEEIVKNEKESETDKAE
ncbi:hypothetical protein WD019_03195 [Fictibacillus sp. Mic-4]|uniref:hypothetical protein n=1 Tax=Fictibacillus sp. Mic-4 TaxID=3132826 RepID=UPI003CE697FC